MNLRGSKSSSRDRQAYMGNSSYLGQETLGGGGGEGEDAERSLAINKL